MWLSLKTFIFSNLSEDFELSQKKAHRLSGYKPWDHWP
jgi:hypothetical protein